MMTMDGYKVDDSVFYKDTTDAVIVEVVVPKSVKKEGLYVVRSWRGEKQMADQMVRDRDISGRRPQAVREVA